jgi:hypothetical protein
VTRTRVLAVLALLVIVVIGLVGRVSRRDTPAAPAAAAPTVTVSGTAPGQSGTPTAASTVGATPTAATDPGDPRTVALAFVTAWVSRTVRDTTGTWVARMRPYTSEPLLAQLAQAAPDAVEAHRAVGPVTVLNSGQYGAQVVVPVDAGPAPLVGLSSTGDRWLVTSLSAVQPGSS